MPRPPSWLLRLCNLLIPLLILVPVLWALLPEGLPNTADGTVHFVRATEMIAAWQEGIFLPRWSLNLGFGYGIPLFVYAPPLPYLTVATYHSLGLSAEAAFKAMLVSALVLGATGSYRLGKLLFGVWAGATAAAAFVYAPIQLRELFVQGNVAQFLAWSFIPWTLWAIIQIYRASNKTDTLRYALVLALALSGALLSHNVVALVLLESCAALGLILWVATHRHGAFWITVGGGTGGLLLSAWFSLPALLENDYVALDLIAVSDYHTRFIPLSELLAWPPRLDTGAINPYIPRTLGLLQVAHAALSVLILIGWAVTRRTPLRERVTEPPNKEADFTRLFWGTVLFMASFTTFCAFMATRWSVPIWEMMPFVNLFEFPSRWHIFTALGVAWLAAAGVGVMRSRLQPAIATVLILLLIGTALVNLYPHKIASGSRIMSPYEVVRYEVKSGAVGTTSLGEFNPIWVTRPLTTSPLVEDYLAKRPVDRLKGQLPAGASHQVLEVNAHHQRYQITLSAPTTVTLNLHYFPGWRAEVNGIPAVLHPQAETGLLRVALPVGESTLDLTFGSTPLRRFVGILSAITWFGVLLTLLLMSLLRLRLPSPQTGNSLATRGNIENNRTIVGATGTVALVVALLWTLEVMGANWFQLHSQPDQALAAQIPVHADIGDRFRLLGLDPLPTTLTAGEPISVVVYWRALDKMDENYIVVLRLEPVTGGQALAEVSQLHPSDIPTSGWATGLYLRNKLDMLIPANTPPIQVVLRVGFRDPATSQMLPSAEGDAIELGHMWVMPINRPTPPDGPRTTFGSNIELLGARTDGTQLMLYWRANAPIDGNPNIFIHLLDDQGELLGQLDGTPYANRHPLWAWQPEQTVEDIRDLTAANVDLAQLHAIAIGIYDTITGERLTAADADGNPLANNTQSIILRKK